jgi:hypothetical protein
MLSSSKLVLQAQVMMSDSEDSKGYLSEGEHYRRSRFSRPFKYQHENNPSKYTNTPMSTRLSFNLADEQISTNSTPPTFKDAIPKKRPSKLYHNTTKEIKYDTTSESELSDFEKTSPFPTSTVRQDYTRKNVSRKNYEKKSFRAGNFKSYFTYYHKYKV